MHVKTPMALLAAVMAAGMTTFACSAHRKPVAAVAKAELAVKQADESTAPQHAELELKLAREKLAKAQARLEDDDHEEARWWAEEAMVDAQLAEVKAASAEARQAAAQTKASIEVIRNEAGRGVVVEHRETVQTIQTETR